MDAKKALIITWVVIGLLVAGAVGFFIGKANGGKELNNLNNIQGGPTQGGSQVVTPSGQPQGGKTVTPQPMNQK